MVRDTKVLTKISSAVLISLACYSTAFAHGYVQDPGSRSYFCKLGSNQKCGAIQYEPQSLEAPSGYFVNGNLDGRLGSAGVAIATALDEQTPSRWEKTIVSSGTIDFTWYFTAPHLSKSFEFYITKQSWDPNQPLKYSDFDPTPLKCSTTSWKPGQRPPKKLTFHCQVPQRHGYQVILSEWDVDDTSNSFYNLVDLQFGNHAIDHYPRVIGRINPTDLNSNDKLYFMPFNESHPEGMDSHHIMTIANQKEGLSTYWPYQYCVAVNKLSRDRFNNEIKCGQKILGADGHKLVVKPNHNGINMFYAKANSLYSDAEVIIHKAKPPTSDTIEITQTPPSQVNIVKGKVNFKLAFKSLSMDKDASLKIELVQGDRNFGVYEYTIAPGQKLEANAVFPKGTNLNIQPGQYKLLTFTQFPNEEGKQTDYNVTLNNVTPPTCPQYKYGHHYRAGDCVTNTDQVTHIQHTYKCKDYPYSGWCPLKPYEPGTLWYGQALWPDAWDVLS